MIISAIVAVASNRVIGNRGDIPWKIPGEQKMFKEITLGHTIIMGRKTYESIGRPLPGRTNIVITRQDDYQAAGCIIAHDLDSAFQSCPAEENEAFICGGGQLYQASMPVTDRIYLTVLPREVPGDTYFPEISELEFKITKSEFIDGVEPYNFFIYERISALRARGGVIQDSASSATLCALLAARERTTNFDCDCFFVADRNILVKTLSILPEYLRNQATESGAVIDYRDWQIPLGRRFRIGQTSTEQRHVEHAWRRIQEEAEVLERDSYALKCLRKEMPKMPKLH